MFSDSNGTSASSPINGHTVAQHLPNPAFKCWILYPENSTSKFVVLKLGSNPVGVMAGISKKLHLFMFSDSNGTNASSTINGQQTIAHLPNPAFKCCIL